MADSHSLFDFDEFSVWGAEWVGMPEFTQEDLGPKYQVIVSFSCEEDRVAFAELVEQSVHATTRSIWFPRAEIGRFRDKRYADES